MATTITVGIFENTLKIRFADGPTRYYKTLNKQLVGKFYATHWDEKRKRIKPTVKHSNENNAIITSIMSQYEDVLVKHQDIDPHSLCHFFDKKSGNSIMATIDELLLQDIENEKKKKGCNYINYKKLYYRLTEFKPNLNKLAISSIDEKFCIAFRDWMVNVRTQTGYEKTAKCFMAFLRRIDKNKEIDWKIANINDYSFRDNAPESNTIEEMPVVLTQKELTAFYKFDPVCCLGRRSEDTVILFYDYCIFLLETFMRPIDGLLLKYENIKKVPSIQKSIARYIPDKKKNIRNAKVSVDVPLSPKAMVIIEKYRPFSQDGYVFPFFSEERIDKYKDKANGLAKYYNGQINKWLKEVDKTLKFDKGLHLYVFRHTAISVSLNIHRLPPSTVAQLAGTSIVMIEKHYNNYTVADIPVGIFGILNTGSEE